MPNDDVAELVRSLGVRVSREALLALIAHATTARLSPVQTFEELAAIAHRERAERNLAARAKAATIGTFKPLDRFDWNHPRTIQRELVEELMTLDFVAKGHNVLLRGSSGVGKTMLAQNLGMLALQRGYTVRFTTLSAALADLLKQESLPALERRLRKYTAPSLLILDEIGYLPCSRQSADLLYNIISRRHESRSLVLTTNLPFKQWSTVFPGAACVSALIDRSDVAHGHPGVQRDEADARVAGRRNGRRRAGREKGLRSNHKGHPRRRRGCAGDHRGCAGDHRGCAGAERL